MKMMFRFDMDVYLISAAHGDALTRLRNLPAHGLAVLAGDDASLVSPFLPLLCVSIVESILSLVKLSRPVYWMVLEDKPALSKYRNKQLRKGSMFCWQPFSGEPIEKCSEYKYLHEVLLFQPKIPGAVTQP